MATKPKFLTSFPLTVYMFYMFLSLFNTVSGNWTALSTIKCVATSIDVGVNGIMKVAKRVKNGGDGLYIQKKINYYYRVIVY